MFRGLGRKNQPSLAEGGICERLMPFQRNAHRISQMPKNKKRQDDYVMKGASQEYDKP
jgi:hypothetical protein